MLDLRALVRAGDGVWWSQTSAEPTPLVDALLEQLPAIGPVDAFVGMTLNRRLVDNLPQDLTVISYGGLGLLRTLSGSGRLEIVPSHYSTIPRLFSTGAIAADVGLVQVSPPDADGYVTLGTGVDYAADAVPATRTLIAEINQQMPATVGSPRIHFSRFAATLETDRPLITTPARDSSWEERVIGQHVAALIDDGSTLQVGVGTLPSAVLAALGNHKDLGLHTGIVSDSVLPLIRSGVLTGARAEFEPGTLVTGAALGSEELYTTIPDLSLEFRPVSHTHDPRILSRLSSLVSVNGAIEVDLAGNVGAEYADAVLVGALGGQTDFARAASSTGRLSIIALRSTARGASTIVPTLVHGPVTTSRADVDCVVTEHGVAHLTGCTLRERARRLIAVAAPEHRESLERQSFSALAHAAVD
ncbi:acetyl-CoA hydrolase/transferase family protein [Janibacter sp. YIM B02568]|uniref:acetyl-CoA hydrolase/transferase family protein n=1 Tax=Janibacter endophyticus TaxID=2806261 RepID=UPI0019512C3A|nr:acetyl-CoA hydrolase/transferase family protein [Janibacter endophyticus]MBM6545430.1 acetyl-CoA hydrolase/transferase family protein [Janibacter endophyticus]